MRATPGSILLNLISLGIVLGMVVWLRHEKATADPPSGPRGGGGAATSSQISRMQDQVEYLQGQVDALEEQNAGLLAELEGANPSGAVEEAQELRGLQFSSAPKVVEVDPGDFGKVIYERLLAERGDGWEKRSRTWAALGLIPEGFSAGRAMVDLLIETRGASYDPEELVFTAAEGWTPDVAAAGRALAAELIPGGDPWMESGGDLDGQLARLAVLEGDARLLDFHAKLRTMGSGGGGGAGEFQDVREFGAPVPVFLREAFVGFPSQIGLPKVRAAHGANGYPAVDEMLRDPPARTAELMGVPKGDFTPAVDFPAPAVRGTGAFFEGNLGQAAQLLMLKAWVPESMAVEAVAGWGGDRLLAYGTPEGDQVVLATDLMDDEIDGAAETYFKALRKATLSRHRIEFEEPMVEADPLLASAGSEGRAIAIGTVRTAADRTRVVLVDAIDEAWRDALWAAALAQWSAPAEEGDGD